MEGVEALLSSLEGEMVCEGVGHEKGPPAHDDGPGRWYVVTKCPGCFHMETELVCDGFYVWLVARWKDTMVTCGECLKPHQVEKYWVGATERK